MSKTRLGAGRGFFICFLQLACSFLFEVLLELLTFLACDSLSFSLACLVFSRTSLAREVRGRPRECFLPLSFEASQPGSTTGAPLQSVPHGHRDTNTGPGSVAPTAEAGSYLSGLTLAGLEAFDEASASGSKGHDRPPRAK